MEIDNMTKIIMNIMSDMRMVMVLNMEGQVPWELATNVRCTSVQKSKEEAYMESIIAGLLKTTTRIAFIKHVINQTKPSWINLCFP